MILFFLIIGLVASILGALPLGASNIAVINTTLKQNRIEAYKIAFAAGFGEIILAYYALHCNMTIKDFFDHNYWIQIAIVIALMCIGLLLFFKKNKERTKTRKTLLTSKYLTGFVLGLLNPPVLIYWIVVFGFLNGNTLSLSLQSPLALLIVFFVGVFSGKVFTLYLYSRFSAGLKERVHNINQKVNKITGVLLIIIGIVQALKLSFL